MADAWRATAAAWKPLVFTLHTACGKAGGPWDLGDCGIVSG